jgi:hypothetical protein
MIFSASAWSEVPLSSSTEQALNGDLIAYQLFIDEILPLNLDVNEQQSFDMKISRGFEITIGIKEINELNTQLKKINEFIL